MQIAKYATRNTLKVDTSNLCGKWGIKSRRLEKAKGLNG